MENGRTTSSTTLAFTIGTTTTGATFNIKVSQIECWNKARYKLKDNFISKFRKCIMFFSAPNGCNLYFTGASGIVKSLAFDGGAQIGGNYYSYCIRRENGNASFLSAHSLKPSLQ